MEYSEDGYKLTKEFEGCKLMAYQDGGGVWTIGYGHTLGVKKGDMITGTQAQWFLEQDMQDAVDHVNQYVKVALTQDQFDALVDFTFNLGNNALKTSTLLKKLNSGDYAGASQEFLKWNHDNGKVVDGLTRRRKAEMQLFVG